MTNANGVGPLALLNQFKQYEYLLNVDRKGLVEELFNK